MPTIEVVIVDNGEFGRLLLRMVRMGKLKIEPPEPPHAPCST